MPIKNTDFDIFIHLTNHQIVYISHENIIEFVIQKQYDQTHFTTGNTSTRTYLKNARLSIKPIGNHLLKDNNILKIQIQYANSENKIYWLNPKRHIQVYTRTKNKQHQTFQINEFTSNHIADLNLDYHKYHQLRKREIHTISKLLTLTPRKLESIYYPKKQSNQPMSLYQVVQALEVNLYPIEQWLIKNNIPYHHTNLFNYSNHPDHLLENTSVDKLNLGTRASNGLFRSWYKNMYQLLHTTPSRIKAIRNVGHETFIEIQNEAYRWCVDNNVQNINQYPLFERDE